MGSDLPAETLSLLFRRTHPSYRPFTGTCSPLLMSSVIFQPPHFIGALNLRYPVGRTGMFEAMLGNLLCGPRDPEENHRQAHGPSDPLRGPRVDL